MVLWLSKSQSTSTLRERSLSILQGPPLSVIHNLNSHPAREIRTISIGIEGSLHGHIILTAFAFAAISTAEAIRKSVNQPDPVRPHSVVQFGQICSRKWTQVHYLKVCRFHLFKLVYIPQT